MMSQAEIEGLVLNAEHRETFEKLTYAEATAFQKFAFRTPGYWVVIHVDHHSAARNRYAAEVRLADAEDVQ